jgi:hypothetical protein
MKTITTVICVLAFCTFSWAIENGLSKSTISLQSMINPLNITKANANSFVVDSSPMLSGNSLIGKKSVNSDESAGKMNWDFSDLRFYA